MSNDILTELIYNLIEELHSKDVADIVVILLQYGWSTLSDLVKKSNKNFQFVRDSIITLRQLKYILVKNSSKYKDSDEFIYSVDVENILGLIRSPKILYFISTKYGKFSKEIIESIMINGLLTCNMTLEFVENNILIDENKRKLEINNIKKAFVELIKDGILTRGEDCNDQSVPIVTSNDKKSKKLNIQIEDNKKDNIHNVDVVPDNFPLIYDQLRNEEYYFSINYKALNQILKGEAFLDIISKKISTQISFICRIFFEKGNFSNEKLITTKPLSTFELIQLYPDLTKINLEELIKQIKNDEHELLKVYGTNEIGKEVYTLDFNSINNLLKQKILENVLTQTLSPVHTRIFRLLSKCGPLDLKNIMEICMMSQKESSTILNQLISLSFIEIQEINIKGNNVIFFKVNQANNQSNIKNMIYKIILNLKKLIKLKVLNEKFDEGKLTRVYSAIAELDNYLLLI